MKLPQLRMIGLSVHRRDDRARRRNWGEFPDYENAILDLRRLRSPLTNFLLS
jgi:hypothetical protein